MGARVFDAPRIRVAGLMIHDDRVVVVRHRAGSFTYHLLPGGGVGYRETLEEALVRDILEETGFKARVGELLYVNDTIDPCGRRHVVNITFRAEIAGGKVTESPVDDNVEGVEFIDLDRLCSLDLRPPMARAIVEAVRGRSSPVYLGSLFTAGR